MTVWDQLEKMKGTVLGVAQKNAGFRSALLRKPREAIEKQFNVKLPEKIHVSASAGPRGDTIELKWFMGGELSTDELAKVAGGLGGEGGLLISSNPMAGAYGAEASEEAELQAEVAELKEEISELTHGGGQEKSIAREVASEIERDIGLTGRPAAGHVQTAHPGGAPVAHGPSPKPKAGGDMGEMLDASVKNATDGVVGGVADMLKDVPLVGGLASGALKDAGGAISDAASGLIGGIFESTFGGVTEAFGKLSKGDIGGALEALPESIVSGAKDVFNGVTSAIGDLFKGW